MFRIMFVCYGNICRSPMAEFVMKDYVKKMGNEKDFYISSSATSFEEIGNPVYPPAKRILNSHGINCDGKVAVKLKREDYENYDYFIIMDSINEKSIKLLFPFDNGKKIKKILDFTSNPHDIADPWFTGDFNLTYSEIVSGIIGLYKFLIKNR